MELMRERHLKERENKQKYLLHRDSQPEYNDPLNVKCDVTSGMSRNPGGPTDLTIWNSFFLSLFPSKKTKTRGE